MPWLDSSIRDQKLMFVADCLRGEESMTLLCEQYGISRQTGYELKRFAIWPEVWLVWKSALVRRWSTGGLGPAGHSSRTDMARKPRQNGRHERMQRTLKAEARRPPADTMAEQQERFDAVRHEFNNVRPHEALGQRAPAEFYCPSSRPFIAPAGDLEYRPDEQVRRVHLSGEIRWNGSLLFVSEAIIGETEAVSQRDDGHWPIRYAGVPLGLIA